VTDVVWDPEDRKPADAADLEAEIRRVAKGASVKLTLRKGVWLVRALAPAATCQRGPELGERDVSAAVAEVLADHDHPVSVA
jgi:hypothetical protein